MIVHRGMMALTSCSLTISLMLVIGIEMCLRTADGDPVHERESRPPLVSTSCTPMNGIH